MIRYFLLRLSAVLGLVFAACSSVQASSPQIVNVVAIADGGAWTLTITITHDDSGWDHYASGVQVLAPDGSVLAQHEIAHPHEAGVPFDEVVTGVHVPAGVDHVMVRARCTLDGWSARTRRVDLK